MCCWQCRPCKKRESLAFNVRRTARETGNGQGDASRVDRRMPTDKHRQCRARCMHRTRALRPDNVQDSTSCTDTTGTGIPAGSGFRLPAWARHLAPHWGMGTHRRRACTISPRRRLPAYRARPLRARRPAREDHEEEGTPGSGADRAAASCLPRFRCARGAEAGAGAEASSLMGLGPPGRRFVPVTAAALISMSISSPSARSAASGGDGR